jgi:hypothetical protein
MGKSEIIALMIIIFGFIGGGSLIYLFQPPVMKVATPVEVVSTPWFETCGGACERLGALRVITALLLVSIPLCIISYYWPWTRKVFKYGVVVLFVGWVIWLLLNSTAENWKDFLQSIGVAALGMATMCFVLIYVPMKFLETLAKRQLGQLRAKQLLEEQQGLAEATATDEAECLMTREERLAAAYLISRAIDRPAVPPHP